MHTASRTALLLLTLWATATIAPAQGFKAITIAQGLNAPVHAAARPADPSRLYIVERPGRIRIIRDGALLATPFLNIAASVTTSGEGGLLGLAFHPQDDRLFYVYTSIDANGAWTVVESARPSAANPEVVDPATRTTILRIARQSTIHNGGWLAFAPSTAPASGAGLLHISTGDGGPNGPALAANPASLMGKILRIDVDGDDFPLDPQRNYAIPPSNPYASGGGAAEVIALGLRNPWRCGFDRAQGDLWIADVGDGAWEEVNVLRAGEPTSDEAVHFGWGCMEGPDCVQPAICNCSLPSLRAPLHAYGHALGCAIIGGAPYRGCAMPWADGTYFFADFCTNRVWTLVDDPAGPIVTDITATFGGWWNYVGIGEDARGEPILCTLPGVVARIGWSIPAPDADGDGIPDSCEVTAMREDLDGDGIVAAGDLALLLGAWGPVRGPSAPADLDGNGTVGASDLALLLGAWGTGQGGGGTR
jgi:glucose/arabinose dehydrogenase